jgi:hypothetical protein
MDATRRAMQQWANAGLAHIDAIANKRDAILQQVGLRMLDDAFRDSPAYHRMMNEAKRHDAAFHILEDIRAGRFEL